MNERAPTPSETQLTHCKICKGFHTTGACSQKTIERPTQEQQPLEERVWKQMCEFSDAVHAVQAYLSTAPDAPAEKIKERLDRCNFAPRQRYAFEKGIDKLLHRRDNVAKTIQTFRERYGDQYATHIFQTLFGTSGTFGKVTIHPDPFNLIFLCEHHLDVGQGIEFGKDMYGQLQKEGIDVNHAPSSEQMGLPLGVFMGHPNIAIEGIGSLSEAVIIVNLSGIQERDTHKLAGVIRHEQQHAINSLYERPTRTPEQTFHAAQAATKQLQTWMEDLKMITKDVVEVMEKPENQWKAVFEREEFFQTYLSAQARERLKQFFPQALERMEQLIKDFVDEIEKSAIETTVKEELLAFYLSGTKNEEIEDILPKYVITIQSQVAAILNSFEQLLLTSFPDDLLTEFGMQKLAGRRLIGSFATQFGESTILDEQDVINQRLWKIILQRTRAFAEKAKRQVEQGLSYFKRVEERERQYGVSLQKTLIPMLISQPMERWRWIIAQAEKRFVPASPS